MLTFPVSVQTRDFTALQLASDLKLLYLRGTASVRGGPIDAEVRATGPRYMLYETLDWLRNPITVYNQLGTEVWWGYIAAITANIGSLEIGLSLDEVSNRIQVIYTYNNPEGRPIKVTSGWSEDQDSIDTYGTWELIKSLGTSSDERAVSDLATTLSLLAWPVGTPVFNSGDTSEDSVSLLCRGWYSSLAATYYNRDEGQEQYTANGSFMVSMGQKFVSTELGFEPNADAIHAVTGGMKHFKVGQRIQVTGSTSNNGAMRVVNGTDQDHVIIHSTAIAFDPANDILGPAPIFILIGSGELIHVSGAPHAGSNGYFWVSGVSSNGDHIEITENVIIHDSSGPSVTVERGNSIIVDAALIREIPDGTPTTLNVIGEMVAQSFTNNATDSWVAWEIWVRLLRIGNPADNVLLQIWSDSGGLPGTVIDGGFITGSTISIFSTQWYKANLTGVAPLSPGTPYWVVARRSGASEVDQYYQVDIDESAGYTLGVLKYWNGSAWVNPVTAAGTATASMPFSVYGKEETTTQMQRLEADAGQFLIGTQLLDFSSLTTYQFRDGKLRASAELENLLDTGASDGRRLLSTVTAQRILQIYKEPLQGTYDTVQVNLNSEWFDYVGSPLEPGVLPVGKWAEIRDLPPDVAAYTKVTPFFIEEATYDARSNDLQVTPRGAWNLRNNGGTRQG